VSTSITGSLLDDVELITLTWTPTKTLAIKRTQKHIVLDSQLGIVL